MTPCVFISLLVLTIVEKLAVEENKKKTKKNKDKPEDVWPMGFIRK